MNGAQIQKFLLTNPHKTAREIATAFGERKKWGTGRQCERHPLIYISGWVKEWSVAAQDYEWVPQWSAVEVPKDSPRPKE